MHSDPAKVYPPYIGSLSFYVMVHRDFDRVHFSTLAFYADMSCVD